MQTYVEIYQLVPDCQVCGEEISEGREKKYHQLRVCGSCKEELEEGWKRGKRKQTRAARPIRRG